MTLPTVDDDYVDLELNDWDNFSLEAALEIRDGAGEGEVETVVVTVGPEEAEEALLACLAKGADRAIRIWDDALVDPDPLLVASVLAPVIERETPALVLCGVQSSDAASSATGIALAGYSSSRTLRLSARSTSMPGTHRCRSPESSKEARPSESQFPRRPC